MTASSSSKEAIAKRLAETRERTLELIEPLDEEQLNQVYSPILSPLAWDLGHIANFEELWLVRTIGEREPLHGNLGRFYDAIENPRKTRNELPILRDAELRSYLADVRERTLDVLAEVEIGTEAGDPLLREGFVYEMLIAHEQQHNETMLQLLQMVEPYEPIRSDPAPALEPVAPGPEMVVVEGGEYVIGAGAGGFAYDNERTQHVIDLAPFEIDRTPVTNGAYIQFMEETGADPPLYWERDGEGGWLGTAMGRREPIDAAHPVIHVSWHEADAFARWAGKRLPTEQEWEAACAGSDRERANLDQLAFGAAPAGAYGNAPADCGAVQMFGDVWEWTSSTFLAYPGFAPFPYAEYSEAFFGDGYRVLRGGAWATRRNTIRPSFRNWDLPQRRQIFAGLRCARDVSDQ
ncbi:MAG: ergothioneine biosynthesis protein EgtB [Solirubrobacterales bacterium]